MIFFQSEASKPSSYMESTMNWKSGMEPWNDATQQIDMGMDLNLFNEGKWLHFSCSVNLVLAVNVHNSTLDLPVVC